MQITANPVAMLTQAATAGSFPNPSELGLTAAGVLRFTPGGETGIDSLRVSGALAAPEIMPGAVVGAALTANGSLAAQMPLGVKARVEMGADPATASPALTGYMTLLEQNADALGKMESNIDESKIDDPVAYLNTLKPNEFILGAQLKEKTLLWRGTADQLPAGVADVVKASDELFGNLA